LGEVLLIDGNTLANILMERIKMLWCKRYIVITLFTLLAYAFAECSVLAQTAAQSGQLKIGAPAPELKLTGFVQPLKGALSGLQNAKGKVVVLEFWATWCAPCIPAMDHLSELAQKFKGKPVEFIAITDEDEAVITQYLKKKPFSGSIALDAKHETFSAYRFAGIPHSVVIDGNGNIAAITFPKEITETALNDLLAGKSLTLPIKQAIAADLNWDDELVKDDTLFQVIIRASYAITGGMHPRRGRLTFDGASLRNALMGAYNAPYERSVFNFPGSEADAKYRISVAVPKGQENLLYTTLQKALQDTFGIHARREMREMDVFVLKVIDGKKSLLQPSQSTEETSGFGRGKIYGKKQTLLKLSEFLENFKGKPVVDETSLKEKYDWELVYSSADPNLLTDSLRERLGLELVQAKRQIEVFVFDKDSK
jgi:uncharacterized protein (TIGR03435 family)